MWCNTHVTNQTTVSCHFTRCHIIVLPQMWNLWFLLRESLLETLFPWRYIFSFSKIFRVSIGFLPNGTKGSDSRTEKSQGYDMAQKAENVLSHEGSNQTLYLMATYFDLGAWKRNVESCWCPSNGDKRYCQRSSRGKFDRRRKNRSFFVLLVPWIKDYEQSCCKRKKASIRNWNAWQRNWDSKSALWR